MNKLLILALFGLVLIALAGAEREGENIGEVEATEHREIRDAEISDRKSGKSNKNRKASKRKSKNKKQKGKKSGRRIKKKTFRKSKKHGKKQAKKSKKKANKKARKTKPGRKQKNDKKTRKHKGSSRRLKSSQRNTNVETQKERQTTSCLSYTCIDTAISYLKLLKDRVANFDKQNARIARQNKTAMGKQGKKGLFGRAIRRITEHGGGNASSLTCNGKKNAGAAQLQNITDTLLKCEGDIQKACGPDNLPHPNMTEVETCNSAIKTFKSKAGACIKMAGSEACSCWEDSDIEAASKIIKKCDLSSRAKLFAKALKKCTNAFGTCRKYEDAVSSAIHSCNLETGVLKRKLKNLKANENALNSLKSKIDSVAASRLVRDVSTRQGKSCGLFISISTNVVKMVSQNPVSFGIFKLIQTVISVTFTCTAAEKNQLLSVSVSVSVSIQMVTAEVNHIQETLISVTGSQASEEEIEASDLCASEEDCDSLIEFPEETTEATTVTTTTTTTASNEKPVSMSTTTTSTTVGNEKPVVIQITSTTSTTSTIVANEKPVLMSTKTTSTIAANEKPVSMPSKSTTESSTSGGKESPLLISSSPTTQSTISNNAEPVLITNTNTPTAGSTAASTPQMTTRAAGRARRLVQQVIKNRMVASMA